MNNNTSLPNGWNNTSANEASLRVRLGYKLMSVRRHSQMNWMRCSMWMLKEQKLDFWFLWVHVNSSSGKRSPRPAQHYSHRCICHSACAKNSIFIEEWGQKERYESIRLVHRWSVQLSTVTESQSTTRSYRICVTRLQPFVMPPQVFIELTLKTAV